MALEQNVPLLNHDHSGAGDRATNQLAQANTHLSPDTDNGSTSLHHTLGPGSFQAASGSHLHAGQYMPVEVFMNARYWNGSAQSIPAVTDVLINFPIAQSISPLIVPSQVGSGTTFNIRRAGIWALSTTIRFQPLPAGGGETYIAITHQGGVVAASGGASSTAVATRNCALTDWFGFNTTLSVNAYQAPVSGTAAVNTAPLYGWVFFSMMWLHD